MPETHAATAPPPVPSPERRPPQARTLRTRRRLLDAAVGCLVERGLAGTTTPAVCARAGVSQGALFKHFATKTALLGAAMEHLFAGLVEGYRRDFARAARSRDRVGAAIALLGERFEDPALCAAFELYAGSRTDPELHGALAPVLERHRANLQDAARELFPDVAGRHPDFGPIVDVVISALQGAALGALARPDPAGDAAQRALLEAWVRREFEEATCRR